jgi:hypothetical protein
MNTVTAASLRWNLDAIAIELDLVNPSVARRSLVD